MKIAGTNSTPKISLNRDLNYLVIEGVSFPEDAENFYLPLLSELEKHAPEYLSNRGRMDIKMQLEYFNTVSAKMLYKIFKIFDTLAEEHDFIEIHLTWEYEFDDDDLLEAGEDFECMFHNTQFKFKELEHQVRVCAQCHSPECGEVHSGDEGVTVCKECGAVEGGYAFIYTD